MRQAIDICHLGSHEMVSFRTAMLAEMLVALDPTQVYGLRCARRGRICQVSVDV